MVPKQKSTVFVCGPKGACDKENVFRQQGVVGGGAHYHVPVTIARRFPGKPNGPSERLLARRRDPKGTTPYVSGHGPSRVQGVPTTQGGHGESGLRALEGNRFEKQNSTHRERRLYADTEKNNTRTRSTSGQSQANKTPTTGEQLTIDMCGGGYALEKTTVRPWRKRNARPSRVVRILVLLI